MKKTKLFTSASLVRATTIMVSSAMLVTAIGAGAAPARNRARPDVRVSHGGPSTQKPATDLNLSVGRGQLINLSSPISDVFVASGIDFFNVFRVGLGLGASNVPTHVKNLTVNSAFPADKKLDDEIVRGWRPAFYLNFVLPGFSPHW